MKISNKTSFPVLAICWHKDHGYGDDVAIQPGEIVDVFGPYIGEMGGGSCCLAMPGEITCHEGVDDQDGFHVSKGNQLNLGSGKFGVTVRHHLDSLVLSDDQ